MTQEGYDVIFQNSGLAEALHAYRSDFRQGAGHLSSMMISTSAHRSMESQARSHRLILAG